MGATESNQSGDPIGNVVTKEEFWKHPSVQAYLNRFPRKGQQTLEKSKLKRRMRDPNQTLESLVRELHYENYNMVNATTMYKDLKDKQWFWQHPAVTEFIRLNNLYFQEVASESPEEPVYFSAKEYIEASLFDVPVHSLLEELTASNLRDIRRKHHTMRMKQAISTGNAQEMNDTWREK